MATSTIKYDNFRSGTVTGANGGTASVLAYQAGRVVTINGFVNNVTLTANTETQIASISGVSFPGNAVRALCGVAPQAYNHPTDVAYLAVRTDGTIVVNSNTGGSKAVYFSVSYIV